MLMSLEWATQRLINLHERLARADGGHACRSWACAASRELRGRSDVLCYYADEPEAACNERLAPNSLLATPVAGLSRRRARTMPTASQAEEGGCGVTGLPAPSRCGGKFIYEPSDPDAEPRQRQGRRHRGGRAGARADRRLARGARHALPAPDRAARSDVPTPRSSSSSCCRISTSRCRPGSRTSTITATFPAWRCGRRTSTATSCG